jgi:hypothetical protein
VDQEAGHELGIISGGAGLFEESGYQDTHLFWGNTDATSGWNGRRHLCFYRLGLIVRPGRLVLMVSKLAALDGRKI